MSRDDSVLYTAQTSTSMASRRTTQVKTRQEEARHERQQAKHELKPVTAPILASIDREMEQTISRVLSMVGPGTPDEDVKTTLVALNLYKESLNRLKAAQTVILRDVA